RQLSGQLPLFPTPLSSTSTSTPLHCTAPHPTKLHPHFTHRTAFHPCVRVPQVNTFVSRDSEKSIVGVCFVGQDVTEETAVRTRFVRIQGDFTTIINTHNSLMPPIFATNAPAAIHFLAIAHPPHYHQCPSQPIPTPASGFCTEWNPAMESITGLKRSQVHPLSPFPVLLYPQHTAIASFSCPRLLLLHCTSHGVCLVVLRTTRVEGSKASAAHVSAFDSPFSCPPLLLLYLPPSFLLIPLFLLPASHFPSLPPYPLPPLFLTLSHPPIHPLPSPSHPPSPITLPSTLFHHPPHPPSPITLPIHPLPSPSHPLSPTLPSTLSHPLIHSLFPDSTIIGRIAVFSPPRFASSLLPIHFYPPTHPPPSILSHSPAPIHPGAGLHAPRNHLWSHRMAVLPPLLPIHPFPSPFPFTLSLPPSPTHPPPPTPPPSTQVLGCMLPGIIFGRMCQLADDDSLTRLLIMLSRAMAGQDAGGEEKMHFAFRNAKVGTEVGRFIVHGTFREVGGAFPFLSHASTHSSSWRGRTLAGRRRRTLPSAMLR
ncbi:unnamed protein product, partial [Closterium sp. NIES-54]